MRSSCHASPCQCTETFRRSSLQEGSPGHQYALAARETGGGMARGAAVVAGTGGTRGITATTGTRGITVTTGIRGITATAGTQGMTASGIRASAAQWVAPRRARRKSASATSAIASAASAERLRTGSARQLDESCARGLIVCKVKQQGLHWPMNLGVAKHMASASRMMLCPFRFSCLPPVQTGVGVRVQGGGIAACAFVAQFA
mmetsp:Transcript_28007/g.63388  ORF Transcript_28007/g.63388 Transcript_28007/m.63388 type:complete len:203 (+) Transcript_28007:650-1258(+)